MLRFRSSTFAPLLRYTSTAQTQWQALAKKELKGTDPKTLEWKTPEVRLVQ